MRRKSPELSAVGNCIVLVPKCQNPPRIVNCNLCKVFLIVQSSRGLSDNAGRD